MDKVRGRSTGPLLGLGLGKDKRNYPGSQVEEENDEDYRAHQMSTRHEEAASRANRCEDIEE
jgi:hypothetical protein